MNIFMLLQVGHVSTSVRAGLASKRFFSCVQEVLKEESRIARQIPIFSGNGPFGQPGQY
jgi:hypothetical protein